VHCRLIDQIDDTPAVLDSESERFRLQTKSDWWEHLVWTGPFIRHSFDTHSIMRYLLTSVPARL